jgi:hypothetical protein
MSETSLLKQAYEHLDDARRVVFVVIEGLTFSDGNGLVSPGTYLALGETLGCIDKVKALIGRDIDDAARVARKDQHHGS